VVLAFTPNHHRTTQHDCVGSKMGAEAALGKVLCATLTKDYAMSTKFLSATASAALFAFTVPAMAEVSCPIKVGVLHSLSGTMAISETTLKDTMEMLIDQQNENGGVMGCELEAVVVDPASDWPLFAEKARELLSVHEVDVIFGNWTSVSRKSVLPVIEELNGLLFYPVQYEGEESSKNVFYTGAAPNQQAIPATDYFLEELGVEKFALLGTDYVYPRTTNNILEAYLKDKGIAASIVGEVTDPSEGTRYFDNGVEHDLVHPQVDPFWAAFGKAAEQAKGG